MEDPIEIRMRNILRDRGYKDIRYDVRLPAFSDTDERAAMVAYVGDAPQVLCFPIDGGVDDPKVREAASFQARALDPDRPARYVWISDGNTDYFRDVKTDVALASLPSADPDGRGS
jgi:hypothetical protein